MYVSCIFYSYLFILFLGVQDVAPFLPRACRLQSVRAGLEYSWYSRLLKWRVVEDHVCQSLCREEDYGHTVPVEACRDELIISRRDGTDVWC